MATHGVPKAKTPTQSYLLLAGGERLTMVDAMELPLSQADTVVLSACESGNGTPGPGLCDLSRAFGYAGAPSVVASLWSVHDDATRLLDGALLWLPPAGAGRVRVAGPRPA